MTRVVSFPRIRPRGIVPAACFLMVAAFATAASGPEAIHLENEVLRVAISPLGAELQSIVSKDNGREYLWQGDPAIWADRAPIMFPVNVRFKDDAYSYRGQSYPMPFLGLAYRRAFSVQRASSEAAADFVLESDAETLALYPFPFTLTVGFSLQGTALKNTFRVENRGSEPLFFALGGHPGFNFLTKGTPRREDFELTFSTPVTSDRPLIAAGLWLGPRVPFLDGESRLAFNDPRVPESGMFLEDVGARVVGIARRGRAPFVTVELGNFPNVNLWSLAGRTFACIEPMVSRHDSIDAPAAIEARTHLVPLQPGEDRTYCFTIKIHPEATGDE